MLNPVPATDVVMIELCGAPEGKGRPRFRSITTKTGASFGSAYTPANTRKYEAALRLAAQAAMVDRPLFEAAVAVTVHADMPVPVSWSRKKRDAALRDEILPTTKPDWENIAKMLDAFNEVVWRDDRQVTDGQVIKRYREKPALRIEVRPIRPQNLLTVAEAR